MAEVYLARQQGPAGYQKLVVMKRVRPHLANDKDFVAMFANEARLAALINHPNVVSIFDLGNEGNDWFLAMEYLDGRDMLQVGRACRQQNKAVPFDVTARIIADVCAGLEHAHNLRGQDGKLLNLVHRDMSPENIIITFDGTVKVVDFGIAKARDNALRTQVGQIKGKLGYVAPEAILGKALDGRADIFALGATLYLFLCGRPAFSGSNSMEVFEKSLQPPVAPREINPRVPESLEAICMKALSQDRDKRFRTCAELRAALEAHLSSSGRPLGPAQLSQFMRILFPPDSDPLRQRTDALIQEANAREAAGTIDGGDDDRTITTGLVPTSMPPSPAASREARTAPPPPPIDDEQTAVANVGAVRSMTVESGNSRAPASVDLPSEANRQAYHLRSVELADDLAKPKKAARTVTLPTNTPTPPLGAPASTTAATLPMMPAAKVKSGSAEATLAPMAPPGMRAPPAITPLPAHLAEPTLAIDVDDLVDDDEPSEPTLVGAQTDPAAARFQRAVMSQSSMSIEDNEPTGVATKPPSMPFEAQSSGPMPYSPQAEWAMQSSSSMTTPELTLESVDTAPPFALDRTQFDATDPVRSLEPSNQASLPVRLLLLAAGLVTGLAVVGGIAFALGDLAGILAFLGLS
jgi:serine/threonine protein kinase